MKPRAVLPSIALVVAAIAAGCGGSGVTPSSPGSPGAGGSAVPPSGAGSAGANILPMDLRYTCGAFAFGPEMLTAGPGNDELADTPIAAALRAHLAGAGPDIDFLPDSGWHLTGDNGRAAEFVSVGGEMGMKSVSLENTAAGWNVTGWGDCTAVIQLPDGLGVAEWAFDPAAPRPGPASQVFEVLVTERACNSGQPADGRIAGPEIVRTDTAVMLIFAVRPRLDGGGVQTCPSNPPTRVTVDLGEPLGDRVLLDGSRLPPGDPAEPIL